MTGHEITAAIKSGQTTAAAVTDAALARAEADPYTAYTDTTAARARARAAAVDAGPKGPVAGVPFAVKNLFDIQGLPTRAGSRINRDRAPAPKPTPP